jgi:hypothetical protein
VHPVPQPTTLHVHLDTPSTTPHTHPNDHPLDVRVHHPPNTPITVSTPDGAQAARERHPTHTDFRIVASDLEYALGRYPLQIRTPKVERVVWVELLGSRALVERFGVLVEALAGGALAQLVVEEVLPLGAPGEEGVGLERLEIASNLLWEAAVLLAKAPPTRVRRGEGEVDLADGSTADAVVALSTQAFALVPAGSERGSFPIRGRRFRTGVVHASVMRETTDTLESRFVHGVARAVSRAAELSLADLARQTPPPDAIGDDGTSPYLPLSAITIRHHRQRMLQRQTQLRVVMNRLHETRRLLQKFLPATRATLEHATSPRLLVDPRFRRARQALEILREGARQEVTVDGLIASVRSLTTLYELYVLQSIHTALEGLGFALEHRHHDPTSGGWSAPHQLPSGRPYANRFTYIHPQYGAATLDYEPTITRSPYSTSQLRTNGDSTSLTPDLTLTTPQGTLILDAKTSQSPPLKLLPDSVLKYLHGLQATTNPSLGLVLVHFSQHAEPYDYHHQPTSPSIQTIPAHPQAPDHIARTLEQTFGWTPRA